jgi:hypothetical protein
LNLIAVKPLTVFGHEVHDKQRDAKTKDVVISKVSLCHPRLNVADPSVLNHDLWHFAAG